MGMQFMLAIYPSAEQAADPSDTGMNPAWRAYVGAVVGAGIMRGGEELQPPHTATTLRFGDGRPGVLDGPYPDTKEALAGFFIIEVDGLDDALEWAARMPIRAGGSVEVRPVVMSPKG